MGLPNQFNDIIHSNLKVSAAWLPITNNYQLGDYGIISEGVFTKMGNIKEYNVSFDAAQGPDATIDFTSADTKVVKFVAGAQVDIIPEGAIDAKISISFKKEGSFIVKAPTISVNEIQNVNQLANQLKNANGWRRMWKVVYQTYQALEPVIISTISADTEISFSGDATALKSMKLGNAGLELSSNKEVGLNVHGKQGIIGLGLFKLKLIGGGVNILSVSEKQKDVTAELLNGDKAPANDF